MRSKGQVVLCQGCLQDMAQRLPELLYEFLTHKDIEQRIQAAVHRGQVGRDRSQNPSNCDYFDTGAIRFYILMNVERDPAHDKCKDNGDNNAERFPTLCSVEAPHSHAYSHIRACNGQHGDEEAHEESEVSEGQFIGRPGQCTNTHRRHGVKHFGMAIRYAAGQGQ